MRTPLVQLRSEGVFPAVPARPAPAERSQHTAKTRYRQADAPCTLSRVLESEIRVEFASPQWAVTPGQSVVLYHADVCLGGGVIR